MSSDFSVVAIIAAYNEADVIDHVIGDLIQQGVSIYFLDDGSTDGTVAAAERYVGRGVVGIERLADTLADAAPDGFAWERILRRKAQLAHQLDARWFMHHDADEFRESPWSHVSLSDAIRRVDTLGFNAIDFASLDFWPVHDRFRAGDDVRDVFRFYSEQAPYDRLQIRCWKKTDHLVDLASSGGHDARFPGRRIFPLRFLLRHYPIRGQAHGERKVFRERRSRFLEQERVRGWHVQYDGMQEGASFIRDPSTLTPYDPDAVRLALALRHRGVEALEASLGEARSLVEASHEELARTHAELARVREELNVRSAQLEARRAELDAHRVEMARLRDALAQRAAEIERWQSVVEDGARRLDAFQRSLSWRWTAPARAAYRLFRGSR